MPERPATGAAATGAGPPAGIIGAFSETATVAGAPASLWCRLVALPDDICDDGEEMALASTPT